MSELHTAEHRTIALAGLFQAVALVDDIARRGDAPDDQCATVIASIFRQNPETVAEVYAAEDVPAQRALHRGLQTLAEALQSGRHRDVTGYAMHLLRLERQLRNRPQLLARISEGIAAGAEQAHYFGTTHENVLARLADLYVNTVSTLTPRINVFGEPVHLENMRNKNRIRALLLGGIRAAVLWRQCGGGRLRLLFERRALADIARVLLDDH